MRNGRHDRVRLMAGWPVQDEEHAREKSRSPMIPLHQPNPVKRSGASDSTPAILERLRTLQTFTGWGGKSVYTIAEIKPYRVPGNAARVQGSTAVWLHSPKSKRNLIIFPELVQAAMRFIQHPEHRGVFSSVCPTNFSACVSQGPAAYRKFPATYSHAGIYLALARIMLGLPADWEEDTPPKDSDSRPHRRDIRTLAGLLEDVIDAYASSEPAPLLYRASAAASDLAVRAFDALWSRHGRGTQCDERDALRNDLADLWKRAKKNPAHNDIVDVPVLMFALLYLNGLQWLNRIRASAVTSVVNRLADAHDAGELQPLLAALKSQADVEEKHLETKLERIFTTGLCSPVWKWRT